MAVYPTLSGHPELIRRNLLTTKLTKYYLFSFSHTEHNFCKIVYKIFITIHGLKWARSYFKTFDLCEECHCLAEAGKNFGIVIYFPYSIGCTRRHPTVIKIIGPWSSQNIYGEGCRLGAP